MAKDTYGLDKAISSMVWTGVDAFNPLAGTESFLNFVSPTILDPFVDLSKNEDFAGRPIIPPDNPFAPVPKPQHQLYWSTTSPMVVGVADLMNKATGGNEIRPGMLDISPETLEYWGTFISGGLGKLVLRSYTTLDPTDKAGFTASMIAGDFEDMDMNTVPVLRRFAGNISTRQNRQVYYENVRDVLLAGEEYKHFLKAGDIEKARGIYATNKAKIDIYNFVRRQNDRVSKLRSRARKINANDKLNTKTRDRMVEALEDEVKRIVRQTNTLYYQNVE
jgi:hypothetical protein